MTATVNEVLAAGWEHHRAGQFPSAERLYRHALQVEPRHAPTLHLLGVVALQMGRFADAADHLRQAIAVAPSNADFHSNLSLAYRGLRQFAEAEASLREALRLKPDHPDILDNLAGVLLEQGRLGDAETAWHVVLRINPHHAQAHNHLAGVLLDLGRPAEAEHAAREALRLAPSHVAAYFHLGSACLVQEKVPEAEAAWRQALALQPSHAQAHHNLGALLLKNERPDEAVPHLQEALRLRPGQAETLTNLGRTLHEVNRSADAETALREALRLRPDHAPTHQALASALLVLGHLPEAEHHYREALRHDPKSAVHLAQLATLLRDRLPDADRIALERRLADDGKTDQVALGFALAHVYDSRGEYAAAAHHLREANALVLAEAGRRGQAYDPNAHARFVAEMLATCTPAFFARTRDQGLDSELPVFIVGVPRSGTTLLEQVLASHPQVHGAGEMTIAGEALRGLAARLGTPEKPWDGIARLDRALIQEVASAYLQRLRALNPKATRVVDKLPDNYLHLGLIAVLFPRAKIIHSRRDLRDTAFSCWLTNFRNIRWANDTAHIAARCADYRRVMQHWNQTLPIPLLDVDYEETVHDLEVTAKRLVAWCGLEWDPACLDFHQTRRPVFTASAAQVRRPIFRNSVGRWKHYEHELASMFALLPPNLREYPAPER